MQLKNYIIKTPAEDYPASVKDFSEALRIANHIAWSRGIALEQIDIVPKSAKAAC